MCVVYCYMKKPGYDLASIVGSHFNNKVRMLVYVYLHKNMGRKSLEVSTLNVTRDGITETMSDVLVLLTVLVIDEKYYLVNPKNDKI